MLIQGPLKLTLVADELSTRRQLHVTFAQDFQALPLRERALAFSKYVGLLRREMEQSKDDAEKQGMQTVVQFAAEILPHIEHDDIDLTETIVIDIESDWNLHHLLNPLH